MMDLGAMKLQFARSLFECPGNAFAAANKVFPDNISLACKYAFEWIDDPEVLQEIDNIKNNKPNIEVNFTVKPDDPSELTKEDAIRLAWEIANDSNEMGKDRVAALKLFAEINNFLPDKTINKNIKSEVTTTNKVMIVKDHGSDEDWENKLLNLQKDMINAE